MSTPHSGTSRGDLILYGGRPPLDFIGSTIGSVFAVDVEEKLVGTYADQNVAQNSLRDRAIGKVVGS